VAAEQQYALWEVDVSCRHYDPRIYRDSIADRLGSGATNKG